jgi:ATP-dependent RNA helicase RhlE
MTTPKTAKPASSNPLPVALEIDSWEGTFDDLPLAPHLKETIRTIGYTTPTPIQGHCIPHALEGRDVLGLAQTGTGKTAAFVLPILQRLRKTPNNGPRALILAPTRELAEQIHEVITMLSPRTGLRSMTIYGGVSHGRQLATLRTRPHIVVACPGRLLDHIRGGSISLADIETLVLDEADRMFDMGFLPDIRRILAQLPAERQTLLFSATMPDEIGELANNILKDPIVVRAKMDSPVASVKHGMFGISAGNKQGMLTSWLGANREALVIVFTKMKHTAKKLADRLSQEGHQATSLHGNLSQSQRLKSLGGFKDGKYRIMVATDIAARGIDVDGITHVIHYDMPESIDSYIHRSGRAGRASRHGEAIAFVTSEDRAIVRAVEKWLQAPLEQIGGDVLPEPKGQRQDAPRKKQVARRPERSEQRGDRRRESRPADTRRQSSDRRSNRFAQPQRQELSPLELEQRREFQRREGRGNSEQGEASVRGDSRREGQPRRERGLQQERSVSRGGHRSNVSSSDRSGGRSSEPRRQPRRERSEDRSHGFGGRAEGAWNSTRRNSRGSRPAGDTSVSRSPR